jgi:hypothetical protein
MSRSNLDLRAELHGFNLGIERAAKLVAPRVGEIIAAEIRALEYPKEELDKPATSDPADAPLLYCSKCNMRRYFQNGKCEMCKNEVFIMSRSNLDLRESLAKVSTEDLCVLEKKYNVEILGFLARRAACTHILIIDGICQMCQQSVVRARKLCPVCHHPPHEAICNGMVDGYSDYRRPCDLTAFRALVTHWLALAHANEKKGYEWPTITAQAQRACAEELKAVLSLQC